jgi:hypothetical protein
MTPATDHGDAAFAAGRKHGRGDRRHLAFQHKRQNIAGRHDRPTIFAPCFDNEAICLEADMAPA